jgi:coproporphyrinogen III oxidase
MSLPELASWEYNVQLEAGSEEAYTLSRLKQGIDWVNA